MKNKDEKNPSVLSGNSCNEEEMRRVLEFFDLPGANKDEKIPGIVSGNLQSAENFSDNVVLNANRGHGFAGEKANHLYDIFHGKDAHLIGGDNAKNGADRLVDGVKIQTKFCNGGGKCVEACFENNKFRYWDGNDLMKIEVPKGFGASAKQAFIERVKKGQVVDISNKSPAEIEKIAKKLADETIIESPFTYAQVRNIAKVGTIESITYDTVNGIKLAGTTLGITAVISFSKAIWEGQPFDVALKSAVSDGLKTGGIAWVSSVLTAQLGRTAAVQGLKPVTDWVVNKMGYKASAALTNSLRFGSKPIYGAAAANSASKLLRGNAVTGIVSVAVMSSVDFYNLFKGKISVKQTLKNVVNTTSGVAGGTAGWAAGAGVGAAVGSMIPGVGTAIGGVVGGVVGAFGGGTLAQKGSKWITDKIIDDDSVAMQEILSRVFNELAIDYLLSQQEAEKIIEQVQKVITEKFLKEMYQSDDREEFVKDALEPLIIGEVKKRKRIMLTDLPTTSDFAEVVQDTITMLDEQDNNIEE